MANWDDKTNVFRIPAPGDRPPRRESAYLIVLAGSNVGEMFKIEETTVIGRSQRAQVHVLDEGISRQHARVVLEGGRILLEDMGSTNGTFCNGQRVVEPLELHDGDKILVGSTTILKFTYSDDLDESFQRQMYESALRDSLTKAFNKKYLVDRLESEFAYAVRHHAPLSLLFLDVDHFKSINDTHGHPAGDQVLADLAQAMMGSLRAEDVFARFGGEEFAVICRGVSLSQAHVVGERLRRLVERKPFTFDGTQVPVTVSVGLAGLPDPAIHSAAELLAAADELMYEAKRGGRNRVCVREAPAS